MIRTAAATTTLFILSIAGPALADNPPPASPPAPTQTAATDKAPKAPDAEPPAPPAEAPAQTVDEFGLPCDVTFGPRATMAAKPAKGAKKGKAAKPAKAAKAVKTTPAAFGTGTSGRGGEFALGRVDRGSSKPSGEAEVRMQAVTCTPSMVGTVVREHAAELELCMTKLPKGSGAATVSLVLTIEADGTASSAKVTGAAKGSEAFATCLSAQAKAWAYPHTDAAATVEYPITVNGR